MVETFPYWKFQVLQVTWPGYFSRYSFFIATPSSDHPTINFIVHRTGSLCRDTRDSIGPLVCSYVHLQLCQQLNFWFSIPAFLDILKLDPSAIIFFARFWYFAILHTEFNRFLTTSWRERRRKNWCDASRLEVADSDLHKGSFKYSNSTFVRGGGEGGRPITNNLYLTWHFFYLKSEQGGSPKTLEIYP